MKRIWKPGKLNSTTETIGVPGNERFKGMPVGMPLR